MKKSLKNKQGFTLIELIIVIVILGILAAVALPKFGNLQSDAKKSTVQGIAGAIGGAAVVAHAKWLINPADNITLEGSSVEMYNGTSSPGYPKEEDGGINNAITFDSQKFTFDAGTSNTANDNASFQYSSKTDCAAYYGVDSNSYNVYTDVAGCD